MIIDKNNFKNLIEYWNNFFNLSADIKYEEIQNNIKDPFDVYLKYNYEYFYKKIKLIDNYIGFCEKKDNNYIIYYSNNNNIKKITFKLNEKRALYSNLESFKIIIAKNIIINNKKCLIIRYEILKNMLTSSNYHFFSKDIAFSSDNITPLLSINFLDLLLNNKKLFNFICFSSNLLNKYESGITIGNINLKPNINISNYGRWYWSGTEKIQNDIKARDKVVNTCLQFGNIINIDLISGEPTILSNLIKSKLLKKLINYRIVLKNNGNKYLGDAIKNILNIYIHSIDTPEKAYNNFKLINKNYNDIEKKLKLSIYDILVCLQNEFLCYNKYVKNSYIENMSVVENDRRIVNPYNILMSETELFKEHRKYLQGLTHDSVLRIAEKIYNEEKVLPLYTIYDSLTFFIQKSNNIKIQHIYDIINNIDDTKASIDIL